MFLCQGWEEGCWILVEGGQQKLQTARRFSLSEISQLWREVIH